MRALTTISLALVGTFMHAGLALADNSSSVAACASLKNPNYESFEDEVVQNNSWRDAFEKHALQIGCYSLINDDRPMTVTSKLEESIRRLQKDINAYARSKNLEINIETDGGLGHKTATAFMQVTLHDALFYAPYFADAYSRFTPEASYMDRFISTLQHKAPHNYRNALDHVARQFNQGSSINIKP